MNKYIFLKVLFIILILLTGGFVLLTTIYLGEEVWEIYPVYIFCIVSCLFLISRMIIVNNELLIIKNIEPNIKAYIKNISKKTNIKEYIFTLDKTELKEMILNLLSEEVSNNKKIQIEKLCNKLSAAKLREIVGISYGNFIKHTN